MNELLPHTSYCFWTGISGGKRSSASLRIFLSSQKVLLPAEGSSWWVATRGSRGHVLLLFQKLHLAGPGLEPGDGHLGLGSGGHFLLSKKGDSESFPEL